MKSVRVFLNTIDKVKGFVNAVSKFEYEFELTSGRYIIDAKSIMGIFSLDLTRPLGLNIYAEDHMEQIIDKLGLYIV